MRIAKSVCTHCAGSGIEPEWLCRGCLFEGRATVLTEQEKDEWLGRCIDCRIDSVQIRADFNATFPGKRPDFEGMAEYAEELRTMRREQRRTTPPAPGPAKGEGNG